MRVGFGCGTSLLPTDLADRPTKAVGAGPDRVVDLGEPHFFAGVGEAAGPDAGVCALPAGPHVVAYLA